MVEVAQSSCGLPEHPQPVFKGEQLLHHSCEYLSGGGADSVSPEPPTYQGKLAISHGMCVPGRKKGGGSANFLPGKLIRKEALPDFCLSLIG